MVSSVEYAIREEEKEEEEEDMNGTDRPVHTVNRESVDTRLIRLPLLHF